MARSLYAQDEQYKAVLGMARSLYVQDERHKGGARDDKGPIYSGRTMGFCFMPNLHFLDTRGRIGGAKCKCIANN